MGKTVTLQTFLTKMAFLCMVPLLCLAAYLVISHIQTLRIRLDNDANHRVQNVAVTIDNQIKAQIAALQMLASSPLVDDSNRWPELYSTAQSFREGFGGNVILADRSTQMLFNTRAPFGVELPKLPVPTGHAAVPAVLETGKPAVGDSFFGPVAKEQLVAVVVPVFRGSDIRFLFLGIIETRLFQQLIDNVSLPSGWSLTIHDGEEKVMAQRTSAGKDNLSGEIVPTKCFVVKSKASYWSVVLRVPQRDYRVTIIKDGGVMSVAFLLAAFTGVLSGRVFGRRLTRTVSSITEKSSPISTQTKIAEIETVRTSLHKAFAAQALSEGALREREFLNKALIKYLPLKILIKNAESKYILCNDFYAKNLGLTADSILGKTDYDFHPKEKADVYRAVDREVLTKGEIQSIEEKKLVSGEERWFHTIKAPFRGDDGHVLGIICIFEEITERKKAELTLQRERHILQLFIEHAPAAIAMFDSEMRYISVSRRFQADYGLENQQIVGRSHYDLFPEIPERWKDIHGRCLLGATERCDAEPFLRASGKVDWIRWESRPWFEQTGKIGGIILFSEVITEQVEAAEKLKVSEQNFRNLFLKHSAVKLIIDPDGGEIIDANEAAVRFYGWPVEQLRRMRIQDINTLSPEQVKEEMEKVRKHQRLHFEFQHRLADGSTRDVAVYSSKIDFQGKALLHSIVHDISERKRVVREQEKLREQLTQAQKMESIGQLAGGVAHDYNNMLSVIIGYSELALEQVARNDSIHDNLVEILNAAHRSTDITRQLLAFARKQTISPVVLDLNETIESMLKMLRRLIGEDIELAWLPAGDLWAVKMDPSQVDQILANLCVNSRDAIAGVGKITIETDNITFNEVYCVEHFGFVPGDYALLVVSDDGSGMDKETLDHIFEPFFTTKGTGMGTGLGLATVYGIVKQNNGLINVYSELGKGTTFRIYLPRYVGKTEIKSEDRAAAIPRGDGERVLLVEDEQAIRRMGKSMLKNLGYQVLEASTPSEAIHLAEEHAGDIHLLLTDVVMPEMNGRDLANKLHALYPNIKILFMSGYTSNVIAHRGVLDDGVNFIPKPFSQKDLAVKVHKVLGQDN